jgi:hypothetical protein
VFHYTLPRRLTADKRSAAQRSELLGAGLSSQSSPTFSLSDASQFLGQAVWQFDQCERTS